MRRRMRPPHIVATAIAGLVLLWGPRVLHGQDGADVRPGEVVERIVAQSASDQTYALYVPSTYSPDRALPVLYVLDPRGRALQALELFRPPAEELGWVIASSYNSRSDEPVDLNTPAFNAMLDDTQRRLAVDPRRLYLAGFSGTAGASWLLAPELRGYVAGIVVAGYGVPPQVKLRLRFAGLDPGFAVFGAAGRSDFNFEDIQAMDGTLDEAGMPNRIVYFDGGHSWMPSELAGEALRWMELQAMRSGLRPQDPALVAEARDEVVGRVGDLVAEGRELEAVSLLDGAIVDLGGDATGLADQRGRLADTDAYRRQARRRDEQSREAAAYARTRDGWFGAGALEESLDPDRMARDLRVRELLERAGGEDRDDALQAQRLLASSAALLSFYGPRAALEEGSPEHALGFLDVAEMIQPGNPGLCRFRAFAHAQRGAVDEALTALRCWTGGSNVSAEALLSERYLEPISSEPEFLALIKGLRGR